MSVHKYEFTRLLEEKDGKVIGPMSPMLFIKDMAKQLNFGISGVARLENTYSTSTYDHLVCKTNYSNGVAYRLFVDMGTTGIPVGLWVKNDDEVVMSIVYIKEIKRMKYHASNVEDEGSTPIMIFDENSLKDMFKQADKSDKFSPINKSEN